jgi:N-acetylglucosamine-6-sulfatase
MRRSGLVAVLLLAVAACLPRPFDGGRVAPRSEAPTIVVIQTDDQRWDTLWAMPTVQQRLVAQGVTFTNAFAPNSVCCPSRASFLTGLHSHSHGVWRNREPFGGYPAFDPSSTLATWLDDAGYTTGLFGKYLNLYNTTLIPPGWDRWMAFAGTPGYRYYTLNDQGALVESGGTWTDDYSTDVLSETAAGFIEQTEGPLFLWYSPYAPHDVPVAPPDDRGGFSDLPPWRPPSHNEADVSDKPAWVRNLALLSPTAISRRDRFIKHAYESLLVVDRGVARLLDALEATGRLSTAILFFTSDNGFQWGEHRWQGKQAPYEESIRIPLVMRHDPLGLAGTTRKDLVLNLDLAPTIAELTGIDAPPMEGMSLVPLLEGSATSWRTDFVLEHYVALSKPKIPSYCGVRTERYTYVLYKTNEQELYDLQADPYQLENVASSPGMAGTVTALRARALELCVPRPPDWPAAMPLMRAG